MKYANAARSVTIRTRVFCTILALAMSAPPQAFVRGETTKRSLTGSSEANTAALTLSSGADYASETHQIKRERPQLPLVFEANEGQFDGRVKFRARGDGFDLFIAQSESVIVLNELESRADKSSGASRAAQDERGMRRMKGRRPPDVLRMRLLNSDAAATLEGRDALPGKSNYFIGNDPRQWRTNVAQFARVAQERVYSGIDVTYYGGANGGLEYDFVIAPQADAQRIAIAYEGARRLSVESNGDLTIETKGGALRQRKPFAYQEVGGERRAVESGYVIKGRRVGFRLGDYDKTLPLVIDPTLAYSTYLGGSSADKAYGVAVDSAGNAYVTGETYSTNFPNTTSSAYVYHEAFVTKINPSGTGIVYSTYLGGSSDDFASRIAVDSSGNAYVVGTTQSDNFPTTSNAYRRLRPGNYDVFVSKLNATGSSLLYSTYFGGNGTDYGNGIAVDNSGFAYITGEMFSTDFPTTFGAFQTARKGGGEAFVAKLDTNSSSLIYSTLLSGSTEDAGNDIAVDSSGNAYIVGSTISTDFPKTAGAFQTSIGSNYFDAFVTKLNAAGSNLIYSTYLGGDYDDYGFGIAINASGNAYVTGRTDSNTFPVPASAVQIKPNYGQEAFVTKLNASGDKLVYSTHLGGRGNDVGYDIAIDSLGNAYVAGVTSSDDFPVTPGAASNQYSGSQDAFVVKLGAAGNARVYSTYLGGSDEDAAYAVAVNAPGSAFVAGYTYSTNFPATTLQTRNAGVTDAFVFRLSENPQVNVIDDPTYFVYQHYRDFLNRDPDISGLNFWVNEITSCGGNSQCVDNKRQNVSAAYFLSIEFQQTGFLVYKLYKAAFGRVPRFAEFLPDTQTIGQDVVVGANGWQQQLENNKQSFVASFVNRGQFKAQFDSQTSAQYVDTLNRNAGNAISQGDRDALVSGLQNGTETRATVLRKVAENQTFTNAEFNEAFVLMQYFGYLRRNPDDAPDTNLDGYNFWLNKLNSFGGDYIKSEMVRSFIVSAEYRKRFGSQ